MVSGGRADVEREGGVSAGVELIKEGGPRRDGGTETERRRGPRTTRNTRKMRSGEKTERERSGGWSGEIV